LWELFKVIRDAWHSKTRELLEYEQLDFIWASSVMITHKEEDMDLKELWETYSDQISSQWISDKDRRERRIQFIAVFSEPPEVALSSAQPEGTKKKVYKEEDSSTQATHKSSQY